MCKGGQWSLRLPRLAITFQMKSPFLLQSSQTDAAAVPHFSIAELPVCQVREMKATVNVLMLTKWISKPQYTVEGRKKYFIINLGIGSLPLLPCSELLQLPERNVFISLMGYCGYCPVFHLWVACTINPLVWFLPLFPVNLTCMLFTCETMSLSPM